METSKYFVTLYRVIMDGVKDSIARKVDKKLFKKAKITADYLHNKTGKKYYVIRGRRGYEVINSYQINKLKKMGIVKKSTTFVQLQEIADYIAQ